MHKIWIVFAHSFFRHSNTSAFNGTKSRVSIACFYYCFMYFVWLVANFTTKVKKVFWSSSVWLWLSSGKFRHALFGTKFWLSISPSFKFFVTPLTSENRFFGWVFFVFSSTFLGTIDLFSFTCKKVLFAVFAYFRGCFYFSFPLVISGIFSLVIAPTLRITKLRFSSSVMAIVKFVATLFAYKSVFVNSPSFSRALSRTISLRLIGFIPFCYKFFFTMFTDKFFHDLTNKKALPKNRTVV